MLSLYATYVVSTEMNIFVGTQRKLKENEWRTNFPSGLYLGKEKILSYYLLFIKITVARQD